MAGTIGRRLAAAAAAALLLAVAAPADGASRIKDIASFEGVRDNILIGYGLVVGLDGSGDTLRTSPFTRQSLISMLERLGVNTRDQDIDTDNVAAVMVTANLPPFARQGSRIDVSISTMGDAESLLGGTLLATPLIGADGEVYAVAQGQVSAGGFKAQGEATSITKGVPTSGDIPNGGIVEREVGFDLGSMQATHLSLRNPDLTTARRVAQAINGHLGVEAARALDPSTIHVVLPDDGRNMVDLLAEIEQLPVEPDQIARVVIDESAGIIVMGSGVRISEVAIAQGNLTIRVTETPQVSQPNPFASQGQTAVVPRTGIEIDEDEENRMLVLQRGVSLQELVDGLNALGVGPRDLISILQTIKAAGALQADIVLQ